MKKIALITYTPNYLEAIKAIAPGYEIVCVNTAEEAAKHLPEAEILMGWNNLAAEHCLADGSSLKLLQMTSAGVDSLPLAKLKEKGVFVANSSGVHPVTISEFVFSMLLAFARELHYSIRNQQEHFWDSKTRVNGNIFLLSGKTIGILGAGAIGAEVARLARAFNMRVLGCRRSGKAAPEYDEMYTQARLGEFLPQCDFVVNILPNTPETTGIIDDNGFAAMKDGAYYLAVGRGPTTKTDALIRALESGKLGGAGLDVTDPEPLPKDSPLWDMKNVIITPHNAGHRPDYSDAVLEILLENIEGYIKTGKPCRNVINHDLAY